MKPINTFEDAKQAVAEIYQYEDWATATAGRQSNGAAMGRLISEAAELYADSRSRKAANEAVIEDRKRITASLEEKEIRDHRGDLLYTVDHLPLVLEVEPLPFPEESL